MIIPLLETGSRQLLNRMSMNPSIQKLAQLMQERQEQGEIPYVLLLGSSLSLTPAVRYAFAGTEDWEAFWKEMQCRAPTERKALLKKPLDALGLEPGYQAMAQLAEAGYFNLILTLNVDDAIDDAVRPLPADQSTLQIYDGSNTAQVIATLSRTRPRLKVVKLRGDINAQALPLTDTGQFEFPENLERSVSEWLKHDMILVGDIPYDTDVQRCIKQSTGALWCILPAEPASDSFMRRVKRVRPSGEIITGAEAGFNAFFTGLAERLLCQMIIAPFNESEMRDLCFDLGIDYESLPGISKSDKARELIAFSEGSGRLSELIEACRQLRSHVSRSGWTTQQPETQVNKIVLNLLGHPYEVHCVFQNQVYIGRSPGCDFSLSQAPPTVSNWHARISYLSETKEYCIEDLDSKNGTHVDGVLIEGTTRLDLGSRIQLGGSLSLLFECYRADPLATGSLIYHTPDGKELARYIIVPKEKVRIGNAVNEAIRLPYLEKGCSLGYIIRRADGFYFIDDTTQGSPRDLKLRHDMKLKLASLGIKIAIPK
jgi:hypothetical protein